MRIIGIQSKNCESRHRKYTIIYLQQKNFLLLLNVSLGNEGLNSFFVPFSKPPPVQLSVRV